MIIRGVLCFLLLATLAACGPPPLPPAGPSTPEAAAAAEQFARRSWPEGARRATFSWELNEAGRRFSGRGVVRYEAPDRLRLDLFGPRGETYLAAALVGDSVRLPVGAQGGVPLPSPALLWGALGVVRPPTGAEPVSFTGELSDATVRYAGPGNQHWEFRGGTMPLTRVLRIVPGGVAESVEVRSAGDVYWSRYRDHGALRTLDLTFDSVTDVQQPFPAAIWTP